MTLSTAPDALRATVRSVPKNGRDVAENEDVAAVDPSHGRFAVSDGASTSARPEVWARLLVESFVTDGADPLAQPTLSALRHTWSELVHTPGLPWFAQAKLLDGAHATFLAVILNPITGTYRATAIGDSCLLHLRGSELVTACPLTRSDQFGRFPQLISSRLDIVPPPAVVIEGRCLPGDRLVLVTDALAKFLLGMHERHQRVPALPRLDDNFDRTVANLRRRGLLDNDDVTLCVVDT